MDPDHDEAQIAHGLRDGRTDAWLALYDAYARRVWSVVARQMGADAADVADVVQETLLSAARSAGQYDPVRGSLWMWLCGIARRQVALHYRGRQRRERLCQRGRDLASQTQPNGARGANHDLDPSQILMQRELAGAVRNVLTELPIDYETLLIAKYLDDLSIDELAGQEDCSAVAVRSKLARARRAFEKAFRKRVTV
jgi:RNA polymerase sigma-70 factor (ECF subfamily)